MSRSSPKLVQRGKYLEDAVTGARPFLRGGGCSVVKMIGTYSYTALASLLNGNFLTIRNTWDDYEPNPPTFTSLARGGVVGPRTWDPTMEAKFVEIMDWCEANQIYFIVRNGHTGGAGIEALGGSSGEPDWLVDDSLWASGTAPFPSDRAGYGGSYMTVQATTAKQQEDFDTAAWIPYIGDVGMTNYPKIGMSAGTALWRGDHDTRILFYLPWMLRMVELSQPYEYCIGYSFFNEPDIGALNATSNFNEGSTHRKSVERIIKTQKIYHDALRAVEPERFFTMHGEGGHNWTGTVNMAYYWDETGTSTSVPDDHPLLYDFHYYGSGQAGFAAPNYDVSDPAFNQNSLNGTALQQVVNLTGFDGTDSFRIRWFHQQTVPFVRGTNATASAIQTQLQAMHYPTTGGTATIGTAVTVTGTTDAGPYTITFTDGAASTNRVLVFGESGCSGSVSYPDDYSGKPNDSDVYAPTPGSAYVANSIAQIKTNINRWNAPILMGEFGIDRDVLDSGNFYTDVMNGVFACGGGMYPVVYVLNENGENDAVIDTNTDGSYTLTPNGFILADLYRANVTLMKDPVTGGLRFMGAAG